MRQGRPAPATIAATVARPRLERLARSARLPWRIIAARSTLFRRTLSALAVKLLGATSITLACAALSCTSASSAALGRLTAAHNALDASGQVRLGRVHEGWLVEGGSHTVTLALEARCYTIGAFTADSLRSIELSARPTSGSGPAQSAVEASPVLRVCLPEARTYAITLRAAQGSGAWALATWSGAVSGPASAASSRLRASEGSCGAAIPVAISATVAGDTRAGQAALASSCGYDDGEVSAPEIVYRVEVARRMALTARVRARWDAVVSIRRHCSEFESELACATSATGDESTVSALVERGTYFVIIDSRSNESGEFSLELDGRDAPTAEDVRRAAIDLVPGVEVESTTAGQLDWLINRCDRDAHGPDRTFHLRLDQRSRVQLEIQSPTQHSVAIRRSCSPIEAPVVCMQTSLLLSRRNRLNEWLDEGDWYITVEASSARAAGAIRLRADVFAPGMPAGPGDTCATAIPLTVGAEQVANTLNVNDDLRAPCGDRAPAPDQVFRLDLAQRSIVRVQLGADAVDARIFWLDQCDAAPSAALCALIDTASADPSVDHVLDRGTHFLALESVAPRSFAALTLRADVTPHAPIDRACSSATTLPHHGITRGTLSGTGVLSASCLEDGEGPERIYHLVLSRRSTVSLRVRAPGADLAPALFLRRDCALRSTELACTNSDASQQSLSQTLDAGTYFVVVDARLASDARTSFVLESTVDPE